MQATATAIPEVLVLEPQVFGDERGFFYESFNLRAFASLTGATPTFVQDNHSRSAAGVLRGLHYQIEHAQGKVVRVIRGSVYDVAVDIRRSSPTFGRWIGVELSEQNRRQLWVPAGFAHGFQVLSDGAEFLYCPLRLGHGGVRIVDRQRCDPARESLRVIRRHLAERIIADAG